MQIIVNEKKDPFKHYGISFVGNINGYTNIDEEAYEEEVKSHNEEYETKQGIYN